MILITVEWHIATMVKWSTCLLGGHHHELWPVSIQKSKGLSSFDYASHNKLTFHFCQKREQSALHLKCWRCWCKMVNILISSTGDLDSISGSSTLWGSSVQLRHARYIKVILHSWPQFVIPDLLTCRYIM